MPFFPSASTTSNLIAPPLSYDKEFWAKAFGVPVDAATPAFYPGRSGEGKEGHRTTRHEHPRLPYVAQIRCVDICHYMVPAKEDYHDVFSPDLANLCEHKARAVALPRKNDPYLLGYSMTDCPIFTNLDATPRIENVYGSRRPGLPLWPVVLRNLGCDRIGKTGLRGHGAGTLPGRHRQVQQGLRYCLSPASTIC